MDAYVLIQTDIGRIVSVLRMVRRLKFVTRADDVTGPYDIVALLSAPTLEDIGQQVLQGIQPIGGVTRTLTCPIGNISLDEFLHPAEGAPSESPTE